MFRSLTRSFRPLTSIRINHNRLFSINLTSVKTTPVSDCCDSKSTCSHTAPEPAVPEKKVVCDPYKQDGKPYDTATVELEMMGLDDGWTYNEEKRILTKAFKFHKQANSRPRVRNIFPGAPTGPIHGAAGCFTFAEHINNLCVNCDHWVYNVSVTPRKCEVIVELKTIVRGGLTSNDFYIAMNLDALMKTTFRQ